MSGIVKYAYGKNQDMRAGLEIDGVFYPNLDLVLAIAKALISNGVLTKAQIKAEL